MGYIKIYFFLKKSRAVAGGNPGHTDHPIPV